MYLFGTTIFELSVGCASRVCLGVHPLGSIEITRAQSIQLCPLGPDNSVTTSSHGGLDSRTTLANFLRQWHTSIKGGLALIILYLPDYSS